MKFSEILLDLDTGDASMHDVAVKQACGKVNVASAIFEYAAKLADCPENSAFIQEAADAAEEAGLPTSPSEGAGLATEAVAQELIGFYDVVIENAKKVKAAADRDMKAIIGLGKKYGISAAAATSGNFMTAFAKPLATALLRDNAADRKGVGNFIRFNKGVFPNALQCEKIAMNYGNAMAHLSAVFGLDISDVIEDPTVAECLAINKTAKGFWQAYVRALGLSIGLKTDVTAVDGVEGFNKGGSPDAKALLKHLSKGADMARLEISEKLTATKVDFDDISTMIVLVYVVRQVSDGVVKAASAQKKAGAQQFIQNLCAAEETKYNEARKGGQKKISKTFTAINSNTKIWADNVSKTADLVVKYFSDAVAALGKVATGATEGITDSAAE